MESLWLATAGQEMRRPVLTGSRESEAVVIGGGLTGILTASFLQQRGVKTMVLEADTIGSGQTKNTTAKITSQHGLIYQKLLKNVGKEQAKQYADANQKAILEYRRMIEKNQIACDFEEKTAYLYSCVEKEPLQREAELARELGIHAVFTEKTELPFEIKGAVAFHGQAQFHPLKFLYGAAKPLHIYEHSRVTQVEAHRVLTEFGSVSAKYIIFATHFPFVNVPGYYFMRMHQERSYVLELSGTPEIDGMYLGIDAENAWSLRMAGDRLLFGGAGHRTGKNKGGGQYERLERKAAEFFQEAQVRSRWSAQDCVTLDGIPYIGRFSANTPSWYAATGYGKWGMTSAMAAALLIADQITGVENGNGEVFSPQRFHWKASMGNLMKDGMQSVAGLTEGLFQTPRCTHLGCSLCWNPEDGSWDCPCHGSRYTEEGKRIDSPAQEDLKENERISGNE